MTIVCPQCESRFRDPPAEIATERPLQCSACEHEWVRDASAPAERAIIAPPSLQPDMQSLLDNDEAAIRTNLPVVVEDGGNHAISTTQPVFIDRENDIKVHKKPSVLPALGLCAIAVCVGALALKDVVFEKIPQARSAYQAAGLISPAPELEIASVKTVKTSKDGIRQLIIRGEIQNTATHMVPVPALQLTMRGESRIRLYAWTVSAAKDQLKAGERSRFTAIARDYPGNAVDVEVEFLPNKATPEK